MDLQSPAKKFFCFAKHYPGNSRQKYTQPGKSFLWGPVNQFLTNTNYWSALGVLYFTKIALIALRYLPRFVTTAKACSPMCPSAPRTVVL